MCEIFRSHVQCDCSQYWNDVYVVSSHGTGKYILLLKYQHCAKSASMYGCCAASDFLHETKPVCIFCFHVLEMVVRISLERNAQMDGESSLKLFAISNSVIYRTFIEKVHLIEFHTLNIF